MSGTVSRASPICQVLVDAPELMADALAVTRALGVEVVVDLDADPCTRCLAEPPRVPTLVSTSRLAPISVLLALGERNGETHAPILLACAERNARLRSIVPQLGLPLFDEVAAGIAALVLVEATSSFEAAVSARGLGAVDRARLPSAAERGEKLVRLDDGLVGLARNEGPRAIGRIDDLERALAGLRATRRGSRPSLPRVEGADRNAAMDVLMGPARPLSDPASKTALEAYDLPLPIEELCTTASRAASESARIGFPVRVALASPELRPSVHADLVVEGVDSAAAVRETFRELVALAERKDPSARVLGVTVSASTTAHCSLRIVVERIARTRLVATIGFGDAHGRATADEIAVVLPATPDELGTALGKLHGASLLLGERPAESRTVRTAVTDVVLRLAAFLEDFPEEVDRVTVDPLAILVGGEAEVRETCVQVSDAFTRRL